MCSAFFPCQNDGAKNHIFPQEDIVVDVLRRIWCDNHFGLYYLGRNAFGHYVIGKTRDKCGLYLLPKRC